MEMSKRKGGLLIAGMIALLLSSIIIQAISAECPEIGPLPKRKVPDPKKVEMGKRLFFDPRISGDEGIGCATCHDPKKGYSDGMSLSRAYPGTKYFRNTPTLLNVVYKDGFADVGWGWDGRMGANLNDVIRDQITETTIMNMDMRLMHERMKQDPVYVRMCREAFGGECSSGKARKVLVAFLETLVSTDTPFDQGRLSPLAKKGMELFKGKAGCIRCHNGPYFSDGKPHNTGVPEKVRQTRLRLYPSLYPYRHHRCHPWRYPPCFPIRPLSQILQLHEVYLQPHMVPLYRAHPW